MDERKQTNNEGQEKPGCFQVGLIMALTIGGSTLGFFATLMLIGSGTSPDESFQFADVKG